MPGGCLGAAPGFKVLKDLVVDMEPFLEEIRHIRPIYYLEPILRKGKEDRPLKNGRNWMRSSAVFYALVVRPPVL